MIVKTHFAYLTLITTLASCVILTTSFSSYTNLSHTLNYTALGFKATPPLPTSKQLSNNQTNGNATNEYTFVRKWGSSGTGDGQFKNLADVALDSSNNVFVTDFSNNRVQKFDSNGKFITKWGSTGTGDGQFKGPYNIAVNSSGNVYVTDSGNSRIQVFAPSNNTSR